MRCMIISNRRMLQAVFAPEFREAGERMSPSLSPGQTAAQKLADFICALDYSHIRPEAVARCRELLLDQLGCQLIGASVPWNQPVYRFVKDTKSGGPARDCKIWR